MMKNKPGKNEKKSPYQPIEKKTPLNSIKNFLMKHFPQSGELSCEAITKEFLKLIDELFPLSSRLKMGQMFWTAVDENEMQSYGKSLDKCKMKSVILDVLTADDLKKLILGEKKKKIKQEIEVRLFKQAKENGGLLTNVDVAAIMNLSPVTISRHIREYEKENNILVPRRGTIHDIGRSISHKREICYKIIVEGKSVQEVCRETHHSEEAVTRYVKDYKRISKCLSEGLSIEDISFVVKVSKNLIYEYEKLIEENNVDILDSKQYDDYIPF
jgi:DNA-binding CsgD family transcriptional regulator